MSIPDDWFEKLRIPIEEIRRATFNFSSETLIKEGESSKIYKGVLYVSNQNRIVVIKSVLINCAPSSAYGIDYGLRVVVNHATMIPFFGYSTDEDEKEMFLVSEYVENIGSLDNYLRNRDCRPTLEAWIIISATEISALEYLHSGLGNGVRAIHRDFKPASILLDKNLKPKICGFKFAKVVPPRQPIVYEQAVGTLSYLDPVYHQSGIVRIESDVYSFGVVLFEMLNGMLVYNGNNIDDVHPQTLINLVRNCYDDGLNNFIDSSVRTNLNMLSFEVFKELAYKCISLKLDERPTMSMIVKSLEKALHIQIRGFASTIITESQPYRESSLIPYEEIELARKNMRREAEISRSSYFTADRGQLSERWQNQNAAFKRYYNNHDGESMFHNEVEMLHKLNNEHIIYLIGYCIHDNTYFLVHQYFKNGSLFSRLNKWSPCLTWAKRLTICIGAAKGLKYLHSAGVIHGDMRISSILLNENFEAKISNFHLSKLVGTNEPQVYRRAYESIDPAYIDPLLINSDIVRTESDVYMFGVVLFEVFIGGIICFEEYLGAPPEPFMDVVRRYEDEGRLDKLIDPRIRDEISFDSFQVIKRIASRCISLNLKDRPTMNRILSRLEEALDIQNTGAASTQSQQKESYMIPLEEIKLATNNFSHDTLSGEGGFGKVYKGQLKNCKVAIKILNTEGHQGNTEFDMELKLISSFRHCNIIPFIGYCIEDNRMIIVTEYASNHSLDNHLEDPKKRRCLTWAHRLKICLGTARGLKYIHSHRVIHRDVKSGNILLDGNMEARICDFGLSKENLKNDQQGTHIYTKAAGTYYYLDPSYQESGILLSASDVYSFGVVMFEILSGTMAYSRRSLDGTLQPPLMNLVRQYHDDHHLETLVDPSIANQIERRCLLTFQEIAYKCISLIPKERPTMDIIVEKIEDAMDFQISHF